ncbi:MAG: hypothetical protein WA019_04820 [Candidatus Moraniibacteriota bacterium]
MKNWLSWLMIFLSDLTGYPIERVNRVGALFFFGIIIPIACFFLCWLVLDLSFIASLLLAFSIYFAVVFLPMLL